MKESVAAVLRNYGESTAYSCKGHFKTADFQILFNKSLLIVNLSLSIATLADLIPYQPLLKLLSTASLLASVILLISDSNCRRKEIDLHHKFANEYLTLHYAIAKTFKLEGDLCSQKQLDDFHAKLVSLNHNPEKPQISFIGRKWSKFAVGCTKELDIWWK